MLRQRGAVGCYADALYGGTTSIVSEGEQGPGWPRFYDDPIAVRPLRSCPSVYSTISVRAEP